MRAQIGKRLTSDVPTCLVDAFERCPVVAGDALTSPQPLLRVPSGIVYAAPKSRHTHLLDFSGNVLERIPIVGLLRGARVETVRFVSNVCGPGDLTDDVPNFPFIVCVVRIQRKGCREEVRLARMDPCGQTPRSSWRAGTLTVAKSSLPDRLWWREIVVSPRGKWFLAWYRHDDGLHFVRAPIDARFPGLIPTRIEWCLLPGCFHPDGDVADDGEAWLHTRSKPAFWRWPPGSDPVPLPIPEQPRTAYSLRADGPGAATLKSCFEVERGTARGKNVRQVVRIETAPTWRRTVIAASFPIDSDDFPDFGVPTFRALPHVAKRTGGRFERFDYADEAWLDYVLPSCFSSCWGHRKIEVARLCRQTDGLRERCAFCLAEVALVEFTEPPDWWKNALPDRVYNVALGFFDWCLRAKRATTVDPDAAAVLPNVYAH